MAKDQKMYTLEFKQEAVRLMESSGKPVAQVSRELGVKANVLYRWRRQFGTRPAVSSDGRSKAELEAELKRTQREVEVLRQERDGLKKAISIVSQGRV
jgi:transposase